MLAAVGPASLLNVRGWDILLQKGKQKIPRSESFVFSMTEASVVSTRSIAPDFHGTPLSGKTALVTGITGQVGSCLL